jgi:hypothetical protein
MIDQKAVIKLRAQHITIHKSFIYAAFDQDMADPLPIIAPGRPRHQS